MSGKSAVTICEGNLVCVALTVQDFKHRHLGPWTSRLDEVHALQPTDNRNKKMTGFVLHVVVSDHFSRNIRSQLPIVLTEL